MQRNMFDTSFRMASVLLILVLLTIAYPKESSAQWEDDIDKHLDLVAGIGGIAVETYLDGNFSGTVATLRIYRNLNRMEKINFMFGPPGDPNLASVSVDRYVITSIEKADSQKYVFKGKTDAGYDFLASYSFVNKKFSFNLVVEGRGRVEVRQLGTKGRELKNRYLPNVHIGFTDRF